MSMAMFAVAKRVKGYVLNTVQNMNDAERRKLAATLVEKGYAWVLAAHLELFRDLGYALAVQLVEDDADLAGRALRHLHVFGLTRTEKAALFTVTVRAGRAWALAPVLSEFPLNAASANALIDAGYERMVGEHLALFKGYGEQRFHADRLAWQCSFDLRRAPGRRYTS